MTFPSNTGTKQDDLAMAWARARTTAASIKSRATALRNAAQAGSIGSSAILDFATMLADAKLALQRSASTGGIAAYAQEQVNDNTINVATEFSTMMASLDSITSWITINFPKDGNGFLLAVQFAGDGTGRTTDRQFTAVQTAGLRTALDSLIATID